MSDEVRTVYPPRVPESPEKTGEMPFWTHPNFGEVDELIYPVLHYIAEAMVPPRGSREEMSRRIGAVRAALRALEEHFPQPPGSRLVDRYGLDCGELHTHPGDPLGSWCVALGDTPDQLDWHLAFVYDWPAHDNTRRRLSGPGGWVRTAWGDENALYVLARCIHDGVTGEPDFAEPWVGPLP